MGALYVSMRQRLVRWGMTVARVFCLLLAVAFGYLVYLVAGDKEAWAVILFLLSMCCLAAWFCVLGHDSRQRFLILCGVVSGILLGILAVYGGMFWAEYRQPGSYVAPAMGYLYTGPAGFAVGSALGILAGWLYFKFRGNS